LAPSDFHLSLHLKKFLSGQRFDGDDEVKTAVREWFASQAGEFYNERIERLVPRLDKYLNNGEWRKLHNAELHTLYSPPDIIRNIKSRRLKWPGHVARMDESRRLKWPGHVAYEHKEVMRTKEGMLESAKTVNDISDQSESGQHVYS
ncbi:hypothetical protein ANN_06575, partial [Periplaneta americana]